MHDIPKTAAEETSITGVDRKGGEEGGGKNGREPLLMFSPIPQLGLLCSQFFTRYYKFKNPAGKIHSLVSGHFVLLGHKSTSLWLRLIYALNFINWLSANWASSGGGN